MTEGTIDAVRRVCAFAEATVAGGPLVAAVAEIRGRLEGPLRVAVAGRVKAGKSTLLNALVGERVAATDAGECTRVVTWYQEGIGYDVVARLHDGRSASLHYSRAGGALAVDLDAYAPADLARIDVHWPSAALRQMTLIDTPGLASLDDENSLRTREFLAFGDARPSDADAVIYLMPHLHRWDAEFLGAFMDRSVAAASPVNAVVALSRADEIGAGRLDAMESSARIADRYQRDDGLRTLCSAVVPVAGLLAETGQTLREDEAAALRALASSNRGELDRMLLAAGTFLDPGSSPLTVEVRLALLERLGLFGLRLAMDRMAVSGPRATSELAHLLSGASGLERLRQLLLERFLPRAQVLKARSALAGLRVVAEAVGPAGGTLAREIEQCEVASIDFALLRAAHLVRTGGAALDGDEMAAMDHLLRTQDAPAMRLGLDPTTPAAEVATAAVRQVQRWRIRAAAPLARRALSEACETFARACEAIYQEASAPTAP